MVTPPDRYLRVQASALEAEMLAYMSRDEENCTQVVRLLDEGTSLAKCLVR